MATQLIIFILISLQPDKGNFQIQSKAKSITKNNKKEKKKHENGLIPLSNWVQNWCAKLQKKSQRYHSNSQIHYDSRHPETVQPGLQVV